MPLVEVFVMQRSGKLPGNVFQEASRRWEGRRRIKTGADTKSESAKIDWDFFDDGKRNHSEAHLGEGDYQQISKLAASAARAMRLWRIRKESERALITDGSD